MNSNAIRNTIIATVTHNETEFTRIVNISHLEVSETSITIRGYLTNGTPVRYHVIIEEIHFTPRGGEEKRNIEDAR